MWNPKFFNISGIDDPQIVNKDDLSNQTPNTNKHEEDVEASKSDTDKSDTDKSDRNYELMSKANSELYAIVIDDKVCYYTDTEEEARKRMEDLADRFCSVNPDWKYYVNWVSPNELHVECEQNWLVISYPEIIHRLKCVTIKKIITKEV